MNWRTKKTLSILLRTKREQYIDVCAIHFERMIEIERVEIKGGKFLTMQMDSM